MILHVYESDKVTSNLGEKWFISQKWKVFQKDATIFLAVYIYNLTYNMKRIQWHEFKSKTKMFAFHFGKYFWDGYESIYSSFSYG